MLRRGAAAGAKAAAWLMLLALAAPAQAAGVTPQRTWNFDQVHVPTARAAGHSGAGVVVAILDSWVDGAHQDFEGRVLPGADCVGGTCKDGPASRDQCDHGTHVAGTVAASSYGVAPRAHILPVRVLSYDATSGGCVGQPDDVAAGIRWAVAHGARVLNLSLGPEVPGLTASSTIPAAVKEAAAAGAVVVFSAGNSGLPVAESYGADALVVAATGRSGQLASYSQRGTEVDIAAPGGDPAVKDSCDERDCITSLYPGNRYAVAAGTSMAAPHVSGIAALLLGQQPGRTREQVRDRLLSTAHPLAGAGAGLVDAAAALRDTGLRVTTPQAASVPPRQTAQPPRAGRPTRPPARPRVRPPAGPVPLNRRSRAPVGVAPVPIAPPTRILPLPTLVAAPPPAPRAASPLLAAPAVPQRPATATHPATPHQGVPLPLALLAGSLAAAVGAAGVLFLRG